MIIFIPSSKPTTDSPPPNGGDCKGIPLISGKSRLASQTLQFKVGEILLIWPEFIHNNGKYNKIGQEFFEHCSSGFRAYHFGLPPA